MTALPIFAPGAYRYIPGVFQYSGGVAAQPGAEVDQPATLAAERTRGEVGVPEDRSLAGRALHVQQVISKLTSPSAWRGRSAGPFQVTKRMLER